MFIIELYTLQTAYQPLATLFFSSQFHDLEYFNETIKKDKSKQ